MTTNEPIPPCEEKGPSILRFPDGKKIDNTVDPSSYPPSPPPSPDKNNNGESIVEDIINVLKYKGATNPCSRCDNEDHMFLNFSSIGKDGSFSTIDVTNSITLIKNPIRTIVLFCKNCGYITQHAIGILKESFADDKKS